MYYRRNLPHFKPSNAAFFITFRLAGSLPKVVLDELREEQKATVKMLKTNNNTIDKQKDIYNLREKYFNKYDEYLNKCLYGPKWLKEDRTAQIVSEAIHLRDIKYFDLIAYTIMPNHVHMVIDVQRSDTSLYRLLQSLKAYTARECNKILKRSGAFWQHESYDHVIRNGKELDRIVWYVLNNPVKAGLVNDWKKWKWSYCKYEL